MQRFKAHVTVCGISVLLTDDSPDPEGTQAQVTLCRGTVPSDTHAKHLEQPHLYMGAGGEKGGIAPSFCLIQLFE